MPFDAYQVYCDHCRVIGQKPPTREWWNHACQVWDTQPQVRLSDVEFDAEAERRGDA